MNSQGQIIQLPSPEQKRSLFGTINGRNFWETGAWGQSNYRDRCHSVLGIPVCWASHCYIPGGLVIPFLYYCSVLGIPRNPPGMSKFLVFQSSPTKKSGVRWKIENVLEMASAKYRNRVHYLKKKFYPEGFTKQDKKFLYNSNQSPCPTWIRRRMVQRFDDLNITDNLKKINATPQQFQTVVGSTLRTVSVKLVYSPTCFAQLTQTSSGSFTIIH